MTTFRLQRVTQSIIHQDGISSSNDDMLSSNSETGESFRITLLFRFHFIRSTWLLLAVLFGSILAPCCASQAFGSHLEDFYMIFQTRAVSDAEKMEALEFLESLSREERLVVSRAISRDPDPQISYFGIITLIGDGHEDEAIPHLAARLIDGDDLTGFGYAWAHSEQDATLGIRMYLKICRYLLLRLNSYATESRKRAERFLCDGGAGEPLSEFSRDAVEERLSRIEAKWLGNEFDTGSAR